jgi:hypothetical protein
MIQTLSCEHGPSLAKCRWRTHRCNAGAALSVILMCLLKFEE